MKTYKAKMKTYKVKMYGGKSHMEYLLVMWQQNTDVKKINK